VPAASVLVLWMDPVVALADVRRRSSWSPAKQPKRLSRLSRECHLWGGSGGVGVHAVRPCRRHLAYGERRRIRQANSTRRN